MASCFFSWMPILLSRLYAAEIEALLVTHSLPLVAPDVTLQAIVEAFEYTLARRHDNL
jgi:hypothetical protein